MTSCNLHHFCRQLCNVVPVPLSDASLDCMRLASKGAALHNLAVALDEFASQHCIQNTELSPQTTANGGLSYYCEPFIRVDRLAIAHTSSGGSCCLIILDRMLTLSSEEAALCEDQGSDMELPVDPIVRMVASFLSHLLCYTAVVPACDAQVARCFGGCSELPPLSSTLRTSVSDNGESGLQIAYTVRWRLWRLQHEAVVLLLKCMRSPIYPHVTPCSVLTICGALQVSPSLHHIFFIQD
jgi:hypothetical protein